VYHEVGVGSYSTKHCAIKINGGDTMKDIKDLINYIENNSPSETYISESDWRELLSKGCPNWESLVKDPNNWPLIEEVRPPRGFDKLCKALVNTAGAGLALRWFDSKEKEQREASRDWLEENLNTLTPEIWNELNDVTKEYIIHYAFEVYPGEPFKTLKDIAHSIAYLAHEFRRSSSIPALQVTPSIGYVPSLQILQLRSVIHRASDERFLKVVEDMIEERKEACEKSFSLLQASRIPYLLTRDEKELIARVMDKFRANGYMLYPLPQIYLSLETPPLFVAYPELEEEQIEDERPEEREPRIPRNRERGRPETISIEEVLGCYIPNPEIILYQRGLRWCARRNNFDEELLRGVVLIHEIGHWVTHLLPKTEAPFWSTELYRLTSTEVKEGWAQLITWWIVDEIGGEIKEVFEKLNMLQSHPYRVYEQFKSASVNSVINSLEMLRQLRWPAGINDWRRFIK